MNRELGVGFLMIRQAPHVGCLPADNSVCRRCERNRLNPYRAFVWNTLPDQKTNVNP